MGTGGASRQNGRRLGARGSAAGVSGHYQMLMPVKPPST